MLQVQFGANTAPTILLLGAHCDDIEIGCGGTVMQLARRYPKARFVWVTLSSDAERAAETRAAAGRMRLQVLKELREKGLLDGNLEWTWGVPARAASPTVAERSAVL